MTIETHALGIAVAFPAIVCGAPGGGSNVYCFGIDPVELGPNGDVDCNNLAILSADFSRTDCSEERPCHADMDRDSDVDGADLHTKLLSALERGP